MGNWNYAVMLLDMTEFEKLAEKHNQYIVWPAKGGKQFVVFAVQDAAFEVLKAHPGYKTDDLAVIRRDHKFDMMAYVDGNKLDATSAPVIPMAYAGVHANQAK